MKEECRNCRWWSGCPQCVCVNDRSDRLSDFVWPEDSCKEWEGKKNELDGVQDK